MSRDGGSDLRHPSTGEGGRASGSREPSPRHPRDASPTREHARADRPPGYRINESEGRTLATIGTFRIVPIDEVGRGTATADRDRDNIRRLMQAGLLKRHMVLVGRRSTPVVALTREGKAALEWQREASNLDARQEYHAGFVKPREAAHDAQLHALYRTEVGRIQEAGGRPTRVILDYELKREYQAFLNRSDRPADESVEDARAAFAAEHGLPIVDGHLELPDLRIEVETDDGRIEYRDLELVTEHYSRAQLAGKARAGFTAYRAGGRVVSGSSRKTGGTPFDPHNLEWLA